MGSALLDPCLSVSSKSISQGLRSGPVGGGKEKALVGVGPRMVSWPVWRAKHDRGSSSGEGPNSLMDGPPLLGLTKNLSMGCSNHLPVFIPPILSPTNEIFDKVLQDACVLTNFKI